MAEYWRKNPPVHLLVASYMGWKAPEETSVATTVESTENQDAAQALINALSGG